MNGVKVAVASESLAGRGIAACLAAGGPNDAWICNLEAELVQEAVKKSQDMVELMKRNGDAVAACGSIQGTTSLAEAVEGAEFVFEATWESLEAKRSMYAQLEPFIGSSTVLCTDASCSSVSAIATGCKGPAAERVVAAHFVGPTHLAPLVEVCPSARAAAAAAALGADAVRDPVERVRGFLEAVGKKPVVLKQESKGFATRVQEVCHECLQLAQSGVAVLSGVDPAQRTQVESAPQLGQQPAQLAREVSEQGRLARPSYRGEGPRSVGFRDAELVRNLQVDFTGRPRSAL